VVQAKTFTEKGATTARCKLVARFLFLRSKWTYQVMLRLLGSIALNWFIKDLSHPIFFERGSVAERFRIPSR
jgi:hypothetical protein